MASGFQLACSRSEISFQAALEPLLELFQSPPISLPSPRVGIVVARPCQHLENFGLVGCVEEFPPLQKRDRFILIPVNNEQQRVDPQ